jgi:hypothetical protein
MVRRNKRTRTTLAFQNQISRSEAVSQITHLEIDQQTLVLPDPAEEKLEANGHDSSTGSAGEEANQRLEDVLMEEGSMLGPWDTTDEDLMDVASTHSNDFFLEDTSDELAEEGEVPGCDTWTANERLHHVFGDQPNDDRQDQNSASSGRREQYVEERDDLVELDTQEQAMLDLLKLCQDAGTSLGFFDKLVTALRKHGKKGFDIKKACKRQTFLDGLREKIACPRPVIATVGSHQVPKFNLLEQIIDLLKSILFDDVGNLCVNLPLSERFSRYKATTADSQSEVFASRWYQETHSEFVSDHDLEFLLPLIFYIDETGTDAFQRYPLEPLMFTFAIIRRHMREKSSSWRHAGFVPKVTDYDTSEEGLQKYHDFLAEILADVKVLQADPPIVELNLGGIKKRVKLLLEVSFVMGDQKSQDKLCARKNSNNGGAGRIHRGCMCSFPHGSNASNKCQPVSKDILDQLRDIAFEGKDDSDEMKAIHTKYPRRVKSDRDNRKIATKFIQRRARLAKDILGRTYTMHAIDNAFDNISFGSNRNKIHSATLDDILHYCNGGMFLYMGQVGYLGMQEKEREQVESIVLSQLRGTRSSVRSEYPRGRYSKGFSNMALLTADEKVGMNFTMLLALHDDNGKAILERPFQRQQTKYMTFYVPKYESGSHQRKKKTQSSTVNEAEAKERLLKFPLKNDCYFAQNTTADGSWPRTEESCKAVFDHLKRHGLAFVLEQDFDSLQLEYLFVESWKIVKSLGKDEKSYPSTVLREVISGYPFLQDGTDDTAQQDEHEEEKKYPIEEYYQERLYTKPKTVVVVDSLNQDSSDPSSSTSGEEEEDDPKVVLPYRAPVTKKKEQELRPVIFEHLRQGNLVRKHYRLKAVQKGNGNTTAILCDVATYVDFLEISLCMQSYLHYSADLPHIIRSDLVVFERGMREFVRLFSTFFYRGDSSVDTNTCKVHAFLHCISNTYEYGDPMQYESGKGERGLKDWAKSVSKTAQKTGLDVFIFQTVMRVADRLLLSRALDVVERQNQNKELQQEQQPHQQQQPSDEGESGNVLKRRLPHFRYYIIDDKLVTVDRKGKESPITDEAGTKQVPSNVIKALRKEEKDMDIINIWGEVRLSLPSVASLGESEWKYLRAHGALDNFGPYFDWVDAFFEVDGDSSGDTTSDDDQSQSEESYVAPAKLLAFYEDSNGHMCAIVHSVEWSTGKETELGNTRLVTNYIREFTSAGWPAMRKIKVNDIRRAVYAIERRKCGGPLPPKTLNRGEQDEYVVSVTIPRARWASIFYEWAKDEVTPWFDEVANNTD